MPCVLLRSGDGRSTLEDYDNYIACLVLELQQTAIGNQNAIIGSINSSNIALSNTVNGVTQQINNEINNPNNKINQNIAGVSQQLYDSIQWLNNQFQAITSAVNGLSSQDLYNTQLAVNAHTTSQISNVNYTLNAIANWLNDEFNNPQSGIDAKFAATYNGLLSAIQNINTGNGATVGQVTNAVKTQIEANNQQIRSTVDNSNWQQNIFLSQQIQTVNGFVASARDSINSAVNSTLAQTQQSIATSEGNLKSSIQSGTSQIDNSLKLGFLGLEVDLGSVQSDIKDKISTFQQDLEGWLNTNVVTPIHENKDDLTTLLNKIVEFLDNPIAPFQDLGEETKQSVIAQFEKIKQFIEKTVNGDFHTWDDFVNTWKDLSNSGDWSLLVVALTTLPTLLASLARFWSSPFFEHLNQLSNEKGRPALLNFSDAVTLMHREILDDLNFYRELSKMGYSDERIQMIIAGLRPVIAQSAAQQAYLRGIITEEQHDKFLRDSGLDQSYINIYKKLYFQLPPVQDLIRMMVRDIFDDDIVETYGLELEYPINANALGAKIGLDPDTMMQYWASHWDLPSPTMGFEMYHRGIIDKPALEKLLKSLDYMPYWRDKLIQLSHNPYTRVDVRRMYAVGVLNREEVYKSYLDLGYAPDKAEKMTQFTIEYEVGEEEFTVRELARTNVERAVKLGLLTIDEGIERLTRLNYSEADAKLLLDLATIAETNDISERLLTNNTNAIIKEIVDNYKYRLISVNDARQWLLDLGVYDYVVENLLLLADYEYTQAFKREILKINTEGYLNNTFNVTEFRNNLITNGFTNTEIDRQLADLDKIKSMQVKPLSLTQYFKAYYSNVFNLDTLILKLRGLGYSDESVIYLLMTEGIGSEAND